jgi:membrane protease YdiL (CAAX protease family)
MNPTLIRPEKLFSHATPRGIPGHLFNFPLTRFVVIFLFLAPILVINSAIVLGVIDKLQEPAATYVDILRHLITIPTLLFSYKLYCQVVEKREAVEISLNGALKHWFVGASVAAILVSLFVLLIDRIGEFTVLEYRDGLQIISNFLTFGTGSLLQDLVLLCVVFRLLEEITGTWVSLVISLAIFGSVHLANENETLTTVSMLMLSSLIIVGPFILTRKIYLSWGFHAGWNFMQAGVFGMLNSGIAFKGWMVSEVAGPAWITGGPVGIEGSPISVAIDVAIGIALIAYASKCGMIVPPKWRRKALPVANSL